MIHKFFLKHMVQIIVIKLYIPSVIPIYILFHSSELKTEKHMYLLLYWNFSKMILILAIKRQTQFSFFKLDFFFAFLAHYVGLCVFTAESLVCYNMCGYKSRCLCFPYINHTPIGKFEGLRQSINVKDSFKVVRIQ